MYDYMHNITIIETIHTVYEYYIYTIQTTYFTFSGGLHEEKETRFWNPFSVRGRYKEDCPCSNLPTGSAGPWV